MSREAAQLRHVINEGLTCLSDCRFTPVRLPRSTERRAWKSVMDNLVKLREEKATFFESRGYDWALARPAYNTAFEADLQWRLLNVLSDIDTDHPALANCANLVVRVVPTSCARPQLRLVGQYRVIVLTSGYLSAFKGFIRLWLRGCALGQELTNTPPSSHRQAAANYRAAVNGAEDQMSESARRFVLTLVQLLRNELPTFGGGSIFDEGVLTRKDHGLLFGALGRAADGFILFHEAAHVLAGDMAGMQRTIQSEIEADRGSVSLSIIDEARRGGHGTLHQGGPLFFCVELLRLLCEEVLEISEGRRHPEEGRYPGIEELMLRAGLYGQSVNGFLGPKVYPLYCEWNNAMKPVFDTVKWAICDVFLNAVPLAEFVNAEKPEAQERGVEA